MPGSRQPSPVQDASGRPARPMNPMPGAGWLDGHGIPPLTRATAWGALSGAAAASVTVLDLPEGVLAGGAGRRLTARLHRIIARPFRAARKQAEAIMDGFRARLSRRAADAPPARARG